MTVKLIIDTDGVADDIRAISLAFQHPQAELVAITTVHGCIPVKQATANVIRTLRAHGKKIPVYKGCENSLLENERNDVAYFFGDDGIGGLVDSFPQVELSDFEAHEKEPASLALIKLTKEHPDATLVCIGPLTNIAVAIRLDPNFVKQVSKIVIMGGNYYGIGNVSSKTSSEYNFHCDPEAAQIVLKEMQCPITIIPWELFHLEGPEHRKVVDFEAHLKYETTLAGYLTTVTTKGRAFMTEIGSQYAYCDEIAVAAAIDFDRIAKKTQKLRVNVELAGKYTRGQVMVDWVDVLWHAEETDQIAEQGKVIDRKNRPVTFVTSYDVHVLDRWMHNTSHGNWSNH